MKRVLFLCIGNSCRSQMAQGFGARYGGDVLQVESAGLAPAPIVQSLTRKVMEAKNINIDHQLPKDVTSVDVRGFDLIINMSGHPLPWGKNLKVQEWKVEDPIGKEESIYIAVRDQIEMQVMRLILEIRRELDPPAPRTRPKRSARPEQASKP